MKSYLIVAALLLAALSGSAQVFKVDTFVYNGETSRFIDVVILGDGYRSNQQAKFRNDVDSARAFIFSWSPFSNYRGYFNVFGIEVVSVDSGLTHPNTAPDCAGQGVPVLVRNTYLKCALDAFNIHRLLGFDQTIATNVLAANFPAYDQAMIMANAPYYGGAGGPILTFTANPSSRDIATHEWGHSFSQLADEYYAGDVYAAERANMTAQNNPTLVKWKAWIGGTVSVFQHCCGGMSANWYKPTSANCKMESLGKPFCPVCTEAIIETIHTRTNPIVSYSPVAGPVSSMQPIIPFKLTKLMKPAPNTLRIDWKLAGSTIALNTDTLDIDQNTLATGLHNLTVSVVDTTSMLRITSHASTHVSTVSWTINKTSTGITMHSSSGEFSYNVYPNPADRELNVALDLSRPSHVAVDVFSTDGKLVRHIPSTMMDAGRQKVKLDVGNLASGPYLLLLKIDGFAFSERWLRQ